MMKLKYQIQTKDLTMGHLKSIKYYFLECRDIKLSQKKVFNKKLKNFKKILVSCPIIQKDLKKINQEDLKKYFPPKIEFDLILIK